MRNNKFITIVCGFCMLILFASACKKTDEPHNANGEYDGKPCQGTPTIDWGGQTYSTVQIGTQCWMKENLNIGTIIPGFDDMLDNDTIEKYCYDDDPENCEIYGGLYQWDELMKYSEVENSQGICPDGWHISGETDWYVLFNYLGIHEAGGHLKEAGFDHWVEPNFGATNKSGFTALPGGERINDMSFTRYTFYGMGIGTHHWTSFQKNIGSARSIGINYLGTSISLGNPDKDSGLSLRCLKD